MVQVSVIMPVYNTEENYLREAIESILKQTFTDFEFIIIDDCSTNNAEEVISSYNDERIIYVKNEENLGVSASANKGLNLTKGKYVARIDSDDVAVENRLEVQYKFLEKNPQYKLCATRITASKGKPSSRSMNFEYLKTKLVLRGNVMVQPTVMFNREFFIENNLFYKEEIPYGEDWDLWFRLSQIGEFIILPQKLLYYRQHPKQANKVYENRHYEFSKKRFENNLKTLGFEFDENKRELLLNFLVGLETNLNFSQCKALFSEVLRLLSYIKETGKVSYRYSAVILFKKLISYTKYCILQCCNGVKPANA